MVTKIRNHNNKVTIQRKFLSNWNLISVNVEYIAIIYSTIILDRRKNAA